MLPTDSVHYDIIPMEMTQPLQTVLCKNRLLNLLKCWLVLQITGGSVPALCWWQRVSRLVGSVFFFKMKHFIGHLITMITKVVQSFFRIPRNVMLFFHPIQCLLEGYLKYLPVHRWPWYTKPRNTWLATGVSDWYLGFLPSDDVLALPANLRKKTVHAVAVAGRQSLDVFC